MEKSCGTIPYTVKEGDIYYLIIKAKNHGHIKGSLYARQIMRKSKIF